MSKPKLKIQPVWDGYTTVLEDGRLESQIDIVLLVGDVKTGKTTFIADICADPPGSTPRTLVIDTENSWSSAKTEYAVDVLDLRAYLADMYPLGLYSEKQRFEGFLKAFESIESGRYNVIAIDTISKLRQGCHDYVVDNPTKFDKPPNAFGGKQGNIFAWGTAKVFWKKILESAAEKCETLVVTSHTTYEYKDEKPVKIIPMVKEDLSDIVSAFIWLVKTADSPPKRYGVVKECRLTGKIWEKDGVKLKRPITVPLLPPKLELQYEGQSFPELMSYYMENLEESRPEVDEGLEPEIMRKTDEQREVEEAERFQREYIAEKRKLARDLQHQFPNIYPDEGAIAAALKQLDITVTADNIGETRLALVEHAQSNG